MIIAYVTGHTTFKRAVRWCERHLSDLRKYMKLENGIASAPTMSRMLSGIDEELFLYAFMEWIGEILHTRGRHLAIDGKALRAATSKVSCGRCPMLMHAIDVATGLVMAQLPIQFKDAEISTIPDLLKLLELQNSIVTIDAIGTQTNIMKSIDSLGGHFVLMVKKNQMATYQEIIELFSNIETKPYDFDKDIINTFDRYKTFEKNRDRYEYRDYRVINDTSYISRSKTDWPFIKTVGYVKQTRILVVRDQYGNDITPSESQFLKKGSIRQTAPVTGDSENSDIQVVGMISDLELKAKDMGKYKRDHWVIENTLHHVLDDTFREDRSPAKKSKNNLSLIRKFAYNILRLFKIDYSDNSPMTEILDLFSDNFDLIEEYCFKERSPLK